MAADLRQACDRCHDKKLRCPRPPRSLSCTRCAKASASCVFSPPTRPARNGPACDYRDAAAAAGDWSPPAQDLQLMHSAEASPHEQASTQPRQGTGARSSDSTATEQLANTMMALDRLLRQLPSDDAHHVPQEELLQYANTIGELYRPDYMVEAVLDHAQQLANLQPTIVTHALHKLSTPNSDESCAVPNCIHKARDAVRQLPDPKIDHSILNLLVACDLRLLDLLDNLIRSCVKCGLSVALLAPQGYGPKLSIPEVRIGSVVASQPTASSMVMSAIFETLIVMLSRTKDMAARLDQVSNKAPKETKLLQLQCDVLTDRTQATFAELVKLRGDLAAFGLAT